MKYLSDLMDYAFPGADGNTRKMIWEGIKNDAIGKGAMWENSIAKLMPHTIQLNKNAQGKDYDDSSDAKFCVVVRMSNSGIYQATISNTKNKVGWLRVCLCDPHTSSNPRLYFMLVPYEAYSKLKGPMKVTFNRWGNPTGPYWDKYQCSFQQVISPIVNGLPVTAN
jgi:hypothetical protein